MYVFRLQNGTKLELSEESGLELLVELRKVTTIDQWIELKNDEGRIVLAFWKFSISSIEQL